MEKNKTSSAGKGRERSSAELKSIKQRQAESLEKKKKEDETLEELKKASGDDLGEGQPDQHSGSKNKGKKEESIK